MGCRSNYDRTRRSKRLRKRRDVAHSGGSCLGKGHQPLAERFEKIGTYEVYQVKCNLVNGQPPRYRGESD
jgi:hypothetical protein